MLPHNIKDLPGLIFYYERDFDLIMWGETAETVVGIDPR